MSKKTKFNAPEHATNKAPRTAKHGNAGQTQPSRDADKKADFGARAPGTHASSGPARPTGRGPRQSTDGPYGPEPFKRNGCTTLDEFRTDLRGGIRVRQRIKIEVLDNPHDPGGCVRILLEEISPFYNDVVFKNAKWSQTEMSFKTLQIQNHPVLTKRILFIDEDNRIKTVLCVVSFDQECCEEAILTFSTDAGASPSFSEDVPPEHPSTTKVEVDDQSSDAPFCIPIRNQDLGMFAPYPPINRGVVRENDESDSDEEVDDQFVHSEPYPYPIFAWALNFKTFVSVAFVLWILWIIVSVRVHVSHFDVQFRSCQLIDNTPLVRLLGVPRGVQDQILHTGMNRILYIAEFPILVREQFASIFNPLSNYWLGFDLVPVTSNSLHHYFITHYLPKLLSVHFLQRFYTLEYITLLLLLPWLFIFGGVYGRGRVLIALCFAYFCFVNTLKYYAAEEGGYGVYIIALLVWTILPRLHLVGGLLAVCSYRLTRWVFFCVPGFVSRLFTLFMTDAFDNLVSYFGILTMLQFVNWLLTPGYHYTYCYEATFAHMVAQICRSLISSSFFFGGVFMMFMIHFYSGRYNLDQLIRQYMVELQVPAWWYGSLYNFICTTFVSMATEQGKPLDLLKETALAQKRVLSVLGAAWIQKQHAEDPDGTPEDLCLSESEHRKLVKLTTMLIHSFTASDIFQYQFQGFGSPMKALNWFLCTSGYRTNGPTY